jgi:putative hydrolase of the HAD superfamily
VTRRGLLVDYGGVLTTSIFESFEHFAAREGLPPRAVPTAFRDDPRTRALLVALETGSVPLSEFEDGLATALGRPAERLTARLMADVRADERMLAAVRAARDQGVATALVSNSWGADSYPRGLRDLFDGVVISGEAGVRKPSRAIYELGARAVRLEPAHCVFVDDLAANLEPAAALGMATVHHTHTATTIAVLEELLGLGLEPHLTERDTEEPGTAT